MTRTARGRELRSVSTVAKVEGFATSDVRRGIRKDDGNCILSRRAFNADATNGAAAAAAAELVPMPGINCVTTRYPAFAMAGPPLPSWCGWVQACGRKFAFACQEGRGGRDERG